MGHKFLEKDFTMRILPYKTPRPGKPVKRFKLWVSSHTLGLIADISFYGKVPVQTKFSLHKFLWLTLPKARHKTLREQQKSHARVCCKAKKMGGKVFIRYFGPNLTHAGHHSCYALGKGLTTNGADV